MSGSPQRPSAAPRRPPEQIRFRAAVDAIWLDDHPLRPGQPIEQFREFLSLRKGRAGTLTRRIHGLFCALAAARLRRPDASISIEEIGQLDGWSRDGSVAKQVINELELGADGIVEQRGRGTEARLRLRMPAARVEVGELPEDVERLFGQPTPGTPAAHEDGGPQPIEDRELAVAVAAALRDARPGGLTLLVRPLYQGGRSSLVFGGLAIRPVASAQGRPLATSVLVKVPLGLGAGGGLAVHDARLDAEIGLLEHRLAWPGLPARVERLRVDLGAIASVLRGRRGLDASGGALVMDALLLPLGHPRTCEAEPRLLSTVIDETTAPMRRLTRRDIHNVLTLAERLATLTRLLHIERRAHRRLSVHAIVVRYELGILESALAADLAASVAAGAGSDELLYRDLFDLGRVLVHVVTGQPPSPDRQYFQPPDFRGRELIKRAVIGEGETVARLLFAIGRYLLEASPWPGSEDSGQVPTVALLDHFLDEIEHIHMLHWSRARGVPERRVALTDPGDADHGAEPRKRWARSAADPVATRLVTISHLVDVPTLRRWCEDYISRPPDDPSDVLSNIAIPILPAEYALGILRKGFGRAAAEEMWHYLRDAGPAEPIDKLVRVLRNYTTHWVREGRSDIAHDLDGQGARPSRGLADELGELRRRSAAYPGRQLLVDWIDELVRQGQIWAAKATEPTEPTTAGAPDASDLRLAPGGRRGGESGRVPSDPSGGDERLRSWIRAGTLRLRLGLDSVPTEKEIQLVERTLHGRSSPETAYWHVLLARAWVSAAAHGVPAEPARDESRWDKAMRALLLAAGVAAARELPVEMAATLSSSAYVTRIALSAPDLRTEFASQGVDDDSVRVQAAECALLAADAYLWLDNQREHCRSVLEAARLLAASAFPERLVQSLQLIALARNHRLLAWQPPQLPEPDDPSSDRFVRYPRPGDDAAARLTAPEAKILEIAHRAWRKAGSRVQTSGDPGIVVAHGYFSRHAAGVQHSLETGGLQLELGAEHDEPGRAVGRLFELVRAHYPAPILNQVLELGCGPGDEARRLAHHHEVWAVDSPVWFAAVGDSQAAAAGDPAGPRFLPIDLIDYAEQVRGGARPAGSPDAVDVVLFRCSLCRVSRRDLLLEAAFQLLRPGGLVVATDWVQTRTTDRITWAHLLGTGRLVDLETEHGYRRLCQDTGFTAFHGWRQDEAMQRCFQRRLDRTRRTLADERGEDRRSAFDRAFLLRARRDLKVLAAMSAPAGPLGWLFWAARKPGPR